MTGRLHYKCMIDSEGKSRVVGRSKGVKDETERKGFKALVGMRLVLSHIPVSNLTSTSLEEIHHGALKDTVQSVHAPHPAHAFSRSCDYKMGQPPHCTENSSIITESTFQCYSPIISSLGRTCRFQLILSITLRLFPPFLTFPSSIEPSQTDQC